MGMPPWAVEEYHSAKELSELWAFSFMEPYGALAEDWRFAKLCSVQVGGHPLEHFPGHDEEDIELSEKLLAQMNMKQTLTKNKLLSKMRKEDERKDKERQLEKEKKQSGNDRKSPDQH